MDRRQQLEIDLHVAQNELRQAAANLSKAAKVTAKAQPNLKDTFTAFSTAPVTFETAQLNLEKARAKCRAAAVALTRFDRAQTGARQAASTVRQPSPPAEIRRSNSSRANFSFRLAGESRWRPIVMLLSVVVAYLQYYFLDVNLQIASLRAAVPNHISTRHADTNAFGAEHA